MRGDGGLAAAIVELRNRPTLSFNDRDAAVLHSLERSQDAAGAWLWLQEQQGRWTVAVDPTLILSHVLFSATLSAVHVPTMREDSSLYYKRVVDAAYVLHQFLTDRSSLGCRYTSADSNQSEEAADMVRHLEELFAHVQVERRKELDAVSSLPCPEVRGPDREARAFAYTLSAYLVRDYQRPFDEFVVRVAAVVYPEAELMDPMSLARQRRRKHQVEFDRWQQSLDPSDEWDRLALQGKYKEAADAALGTPSCEALERELGSVKVINEGLSTDCVTGCDDSAIEQFTPSHVRDGASAQRA